MAESNIEWTDVAWNPVRGCTRVSEGCRHCYAERQAARFAWEAGERAGTPTKPGPGARPCDVSWIRSVVGQCRAAAVPCFVKQLGSSSESRDPIEWPADLRVRQFPEVRR